MNRTAFWTGGACIVERDGGGFLEALERSAVMFRSSD